jgi:hypothetical protein
MDWVYGIRINEVKTPIHYTVGFNNALSTNKNTKELDGKTDRSAHEFVYFSAN